VLRQYPWPATSDRFTGAYLSGAILTDSGAIAGIGGCSNRALVQNLNRWTTTYAYEFDHRTGPGLTPQPTGYVWGAGHAAELAYVWPSFNNGTSIAARFSGAEKQLSREMTAYWAGFVSGHEPRAEGLPRWPTADDGDVMSLHAGGASTVVSDDDVAREHRCTFWAGPVT
jgi:para-nitrobenzyl esterase